VATRETINLDFENRCGIKLPSCPIMKSIKDPAFRIPIIDPLQRHKGFPNSANKPMLITGVDIETGIRGDYVVKLMKAERMPKRQQ